MTHPTDKELDAMVMRAHRYTYKAGHDEALFVLDLSDAITSLRAQLAEAQAEREAAVKDAAEWATIAADNSDRADRVEAERAAQIDADAGIAYEVAHNTNDISKIRDAIRNQPHDRTALDRMLAEMRVGALSEAADLGDTSCNNGGLAKSPAHFLKMEEHAWYRKSCEDYSAAILALIDKEGA